MRKVAEKPCKDRRNCETQNKVVNRTMNTKLSRVFRSAMTQLMEMGSEFAVKLRWPTEIGSKLCRIVFGSYEVIILLPRSSGSNIIYGVSLPFKVSLSSFWRGSRPILGLYSDSRLSGIKQFKPHVG